MEINWSEIKKIGNFFQLTIEGSVTPQNIYHIVKNMVSYDRIVITSYDMESENFNMLSQEFTKYSIENEVLNYGLGVESGWFDCIFEYTDYGESQDSYQLLKTSTNKLSTEFDISVDYRGIPDLTIKCISKKYLESILEEIKSQIKSTE